VGTHLSSLLLPRLIGDRYHTIEEFNKGIYEYIIATDESGGRNEELDSDSEEEVNELVDEDEDCKWERKMTREGC
jgi:hypothetical protein